MAKPPPYNDIEMENIGGLPSYQDLIMEVLEQPPPPIHYATEIPNQTILYNNARFLKPPQSDIPEQKYKSYFRSVKGKYKTVMNLYDKRLNTDAWELYKFILTHTEPPRLYITIEGKKSDKTEFKITLDLTALIKPKWSRLYVGAEASKKILQENPSWTQVTIRDVLERYTTSKFRLRRMFWKKSIMHIDWPRLRSALTKIVKDSGYHYEISLAIDNYNKIIVLRSSYVLRLLRDIQMGLAMMFTLLLLPLAIIFTLILAFVFDQPVVFDWFTSKEGNIDEALCMLFYPKGSLEKFIKKHTRDIKAAITKSRYFHGEAVDVHWTRTGNR